MDRELTFGEKAVGLTFNHAEGETAKKVNDIKVAYAAIIDQLDGERSLDNSNETSTQASERKRLLSIAITEAQGAQMWAVKAVTWGAK